MWVADGEIKDAIAESSPWKMVHKDVAFVRILVAGTVKVVPLSQVFKSEDKAFSCALTWVHEAMRVCDQRVKDLIARKKSNGE